MINLFIPTMASKAPDPAMAFCQKLVGKWEMKTGEAKVTQEFRSEVGGEALSGDGTLTAGNFRLEMHSRFGWDAKVKKVYYIDAHAQDTVYFGHCWMVGEEFRNDFTALVGSPGHWVQHARFTDRDTFDSSLFAVDRFGKEKLVEHFVFKRTK